MLITKNPYASLELNSDYKIQALTQRNIFTITYIALFGLIHLWSYNILLWGNVERNYAFYYYCALTIFIIFPAGLYKTASFYFLYIYRLDAKLYVHLIVWIIFSITLLFFFISIILDLNTINPIYVNLTIFTTYLLLVGYAIRYYKVYTTLMQGAQGKRYIKNITKMNLWKITNKHKDILKLPKNGIYFHTLLLWPFKCCPFLLFILSIFVVPTLIGIAWIFFPAEFFVICALISAPYLGILIGKQWALRKFILNVQEDHQQIIFNEIVSTD